MVEPAFATLSHLQRPTEIPFSLGRYLEGTPPYLDGAVTCATGEGLDGGIVLPSCRYPLGATTTWYRAVPCPLPYSAPAPTGSNLHAGVETVERSESANILVQAWPAFRGPNVASIPRLRVCRSA